MTNTTVTIDYLPESATKYIHNSIQKQAIVCIDVFRATTTAITALSLGRDVYPVATTDEAFELAKILDNPLLIGEQGGNIPYGFDLTNSPVQVIALHEIPSGDYTQPDRELILLSSSGTRLIKNVATSPAVYIACLRNLTVMADYLSDNYKHVVILGAGTHGEFRREDQMGCAWLAEKLLNRGYTASSILTQDCIKHWSGKSINEARLGRSADYLKRSGQVHDMEFILHHFDDLDLVAKYVKDKFKLIKGSTNSKHPW